MDLLTDSNIFSQYSGISSHSFGCLYSSHLEEINWNGHGWWSFHIECTIPCPFRHKTTFNVQTDQTFGGISIPLIGYFSQLPVTTRCDLLEPSIMDTYTKYPYQEFHVTRALSLLLAQQHAQWIHNLLVTYQTHGFPCMIISWDFY